MLINGQPGSWQALAVLGLEATGSAWAVIGAQAGLRVVCFETDAARLAAGQDRVKADIESAQATAANLVFTTRPDDAADTDLIVDALPDWLVGKKEVVGLVAASSRASTPFVSTSTLPLSCLASALGPGRSIVGVHMGDPALATGALELVCTPATEPHVRGQITDLIGRIGRGCVETGERPGLISDSLLLGYRNRAARMFADGYARAADIDAAMTLGCGLPAGPLAELTRMGLRDAADTLSRLYDLTGDDEYRPAALLAGLTGNGRSKRGQAQGFFDDPSQRPRALTTPEPGAAIRAVGIVGTGTMATGIAEACVCAGFGVHVVGRGPQRAEQARAAVEAALDRRVRRGRLAADERDRAAARLTVGTDLAELTPRDLVIEAITEDLAAKCQLIGALDQVCGPLTVLATTTSSLSVTACAEASVHPERVVGLHFFNPAPVMRLVEIAHTKHTAPAISAAVHGFCAALGKHGIRCDDRAGFIANALLLPYLNRAVRMVDSGYAFVEDIDAVIEKGCGYPMGPFRVMDAVGLDVILSALRGLHQAFADPASAPATMLAELVDAGCLGRKSGIGFYRYDAISAR